MPVWRALGKTRWVVQARTLPKTLEHRRPSCWRCCWGLAMWPARSPGVEGHAGTGACGRTSSPASTAGRRADCRPRRYGGQRTKRWSSSRNPDLEVAISGVQGDRLANSERLAAVQHSLVVEKKLSVDERIRLEGERAELEQKQLTFDNQWALYKIKQMELDVKSPINGLVVTWDLRNRLDPPAGAAGPSPAPRGRPRRAVATGAAHAREPRRPHRRVPARPVRAIAGEAAGDAPRGDPRQTGRGGRGRRRRQGRGRRAGGRPR